MDVFPPGSAIRSRFRLWRVGAQEGDVLIATSIDGDEAQQTRFYAPFEDIQPNQLESPSPDIVGHAQGQDLPLRAYRLLHGPDADPPLFFSSAQGIPFDQEQAAETPDANCLPVLTKGRHSLTC